MKTAHLLTLFVALTHLQAAPPQYSVTVLDLDVLGSLGSEGKGINASGQIAGHYNASDGKAHAVIWTGTTPTILDDLGSLYGSYGYGINASGQVAGRFNIGGGASHAVRWTGTIPTDLGGTNSYGFGINASGEIAGISSDRAIRWTGTTAADLGVGQAYSINASGQVVGFYINTTYNEAQAALWADGLLIPLGTLGGRRSFAFGINDSGQIVGSSTFFSDGGGFFTGPHAVLWTGTFPFDLGTLGGSQSSAFAINASGDVIGTAFTAGDAANNVFLYTDGTMYDLNTLLVPGSGVTNLAIFPFSNCFNDRGEIAATGYISGKNHALRLTPLHPDADGDGLLDSWELTWWGTTTGHSALDDFDRDGNPELLEEAFGLNPTQPDTLPAAVNEGGHLTITLTKNPGVTYEVQTAATPDAPAFSPTTTTVLTDNAMTLKVRDNIPITATPTRYLRVKVTAAP